jgi:ADP-L-glycero-D-manno-heptose 6-epimerase
VPIAPRTSKISIALMTVHGECPIEYIPFPADLEGRYQHNTEADLTVSAFFDS